MKRKSLFKGDCRASQMNSHIARPRKRKIAGLLLAILLVAAPIAGFGQGQPTAPSATAPPQVVDPAVAQKLIDAYRYHELAIACIKRGEFDLAVTTARQIIQLHLPSDYQDKVVASLAMVTEKLAEARRFDLGHVLVDEALKVSKADANRVNLLIIKAGLFHMAGDDGKMVEYLRKAMDLQSRIGG